jgi:gamma-glutamyl-gamma-aminobutyrate hydrolase PuuD
MKAFMLFFFFIFLASHIHASCKLPAGERIIIGCTYNKCDRATRVRLKGAAATLGHRLTFVQLDQNHHAQDILESIDALLISGGADIDPKYYLKDVTPELQQYTAANLHMVVFTDEGKQRDPFEYHLLKEFLAGKESYKKLPLLGICRGMQMMSVAQGIPLYLDIASELNIPNRYHKFDRIHLTAEDSLMRKLYGNRSFLGWELHHQGIRMDYYNTYKENFPQVKVSSLSNKGLIAESIEYVGYNALGVQYHPELSFPSTTYPIFKWFLTKACDYKKFLKGYP